MVCSDVFLKGFSIAFLNDYCHFEAAGMLKFLIRSTLLNGFTQDFRGSGQTEPLILYTLDQ